MDWFQVSQISLEIKLSRFGLNGRGCDWPYSSRTGAKFRDLVTATVEEQRYQVLIVSINVNCTVVCTKESSWLNCS